MEYAISCPEHSVLRIPNVSSYGTTVLDFTDVCEIGSASVNADYRFALVNTPWLDKHYSSVLEGQASSSFEEKILDVKELYLQTLLKVFPRLGSRLLSLAQAEDGWDGRDANSMSFESLGQFRRFLIKADLFADDIGLYLDHSGFLILSYTSSKHGLVDMTFHSAGVDVCADDFENEMSVEQAVTFVKSQS
ncbi:hypothetical protein [Erwinia rhapontici]|uniref:hypothetical protein n=1 Tax=Erwinia rhapontici TaxID=55212 RepID=UPI003BA108C5